MVLSIQLHEDPGYVDAQNGMLKIVWNIRYRDYSFKHFEDRDIPESSRSHGMTAEGRARTVHGGATTVAHDPQLIKWYSDPEREYPAEILVMRPEDFDDTFAGKLAELGVEYELV